MARKLIRLALVVFVGLIASCFGSATWLVAPVDPIRHPDLVVASRLPHAVPKDPGGLSFRFAMVHDVLCERYPKHGPDYYLARNRHTRDKLAALAPDDAARFPLMDDLGAGLSRLGKHDEATGLMRAKLIQQQAKGLSGRDLYSTYANLGTFLMLGSLGNAVAGDVAAQERFRESVDFIRKSVAVNPESHFGREQWQLVFGEYILAAIDKPELLKDYDFVGDSLDAPSSQFVWKDAYFDTGYGRTYDWDFSRGRVVDEFPELRLDRASSDESAFHASRKAIRNHITKIGAESQWKDVAVPALRISVAFDEPSLGIIGMWRQGGGPNPYFALALGEIMFRVGQRYIAWAAFERAERMTAHYWPDPTVQDVYRHHCRHRQQAIEESLTPTEREQLRSRFQAELAFGEQFQKDYQKYEAEKLATGTSVFDEHLFDDFYRVREPIASPSGSEELFLGLDRVRESEYRRQRAWASGLFAAGVSTMLTALTLRVIARLRSRGKRVADTSNTAAPDAAP